MNGPQAGDAAPDFEAPAGGGGSPRLPSLGGKTVVPCFYPKDDTPGCAREARGFRDNMVALSAAGGKVVRVWRKVKVAGHAEAVTEAARALA